MEEPACKKPKVESLDAGDVDGLSELDKLDPLPDNASGPSTSQAGPGSGVMGASGGALSSQTSYGNPQPSVLQELLMHQPPTSNSSRNMQQQYTGGPQMTPNNFATRSPMTSTGNPGPAMMSPPTTMVPSGRVSNGPGPSPGGPQGGPPGVPQQIRQPQHSGMYAAPGSAGDPSGLSMQQQYMMQNSQMRYTGSYGGQPPNQVGYPPNAPGRGQPHVGAPPQMMNGVPPMVRPPMQRPGPGTMPMQMNMMRPMDARQYPQQPPYAPQQRPEFVQHTNYGMNRGPPYADPRMMQMHPGQQPPNGPPMMGMDGGMGMPRNIPPQQNMTSAPPMCMPNGMPGGPGPQQHPPQQMQQPPQGPPMQQQPPQMTPPQQQRNAMPCNSNTSTQDPEKRKLIQQQLVLLLHAHKCQQREKESATQGTQANPCTLPHCNTMKEVLHHMTTCNNGRSCQYAHCASSRQIIAHWKNCMREDCPVCKPLKSIQSNPSASAMNDMTSLLGPNSVGPNSVAGSMGPHSVDVPLGQFGSPASVSMAGPSQAQQGQTAQPSAQPQANQLPSGPMNSAALLKDYHPPMNDPFRSPNPPPNKQIMAHHGLPPSIEKGPNDLVTADFPPPEQPMETKDWHQSVTKDLRNHLVGKLVKAIFPAPDPNSLYDARIKELISYARNVEKEMFEQANDREEYYHLLAEKIYKIQKELQEKKTNRLKTSDGKEGFSVSVNELEDLDKPGPPNRTIGPPSSSLMSSFQSLGGPTTSQSNHLQLSDAMDQLRNSAMDVSQPAPVPGGLGMSATPTSAVSTPKLMKPEPMDESLLPNSSASTPATSNGIASNVKTEPGSCPAVPGSSANPASVKPLQTKQEASPRKEPSVKREPTPPPGDDRNFEVDELRRFLRPVWEKLNSSDDAMPFQIPVDPVLLGIPDYLDIVKTPMDLLTISTKLDNGVYKNPWEFCDDMWLMFENAWLYNRKNSKVYKFASKLSEMFMAEMDPVMRRMGYCCARKLSFTPLALFCYGAAMCTIARDQPYMVYEHNSTNYGVTVSERYTYCLKCFEALPPEGISLSDTSEDMAPKDQFKQMKNNVIDYEPFETCKYCHRKWHKICALYDKKVFSEGFACDTCRSQKSYPKPENRFTAKKLPHNKLSTFLEDRVNTFLKNRKCDKYEVIIRTLCVQDKEVEVKPQMKQKYASTGFPEKFPYRTKAVFAFEVIDGVEVCFFGLHVQEYGSNCPKPNNRRVYIAYLDSVYFFQPRELRTDVYHEILLGYLQYVKQQGYTMAHIWACPPSEGDDYIFHCHPPEQKIPKPKRLQDWYKKMLEKGVEEQTVVEFKDIYKQAKDDDLRTPMSLPYFEGDFWPNVIEECIKEANQEEAQRKKQEATEVDEEEDDIYTTNDNGKKKSSKNKKNNLKKNSKMNKKKQGSSTGNEVADKLFSQFEKHKEVFFTIRLVTPQKELTLQDKPIEDADGLMPSEMMDGRDTFLTRAREEHWEFSSLRRAKYSTLALCHALHESESGAKENIHCNKCSGSNARYHCNTCEDYDLCESCYSSHPHEHPMEQIKSLIGGEAEGAGTSRYESIQRCIASLVHACQCRDANCRRMSCHKMKRVVQHTKMCKKRVNASCPVCKQLIALCCYHAKHCNRDPCTVPFCMNIRQKLAEQKRVTTRRAEKMMRRRMEVLHAGVGGPQNASTSSQSSGGAGTNTNAPTPPAAKPMSIGVGQKGGNGMATPHVGSTGGSQMAPGMVQPNAVGGQPMMGQQQQQQAQHLQRPPGPGYGNAMMQQPQGGLSGMVMQPTGAQGGAQPSRYGTGQQMQSVMPSMMSGPGGMMPNQQMRPGAGIPPGTSAAPPMQTRPGQMQPPPYRGNSNQMQPAAYPNPGMNQMMNQQMMAGGMMRPPGQGPAGPSGPTPQAPMPNMGDASMQRQLQQIEMRLKQTKSDEEREQLCAELKKTPHLFSAFLKLTRAQNQDQSQQHMYSSHYPYRPMATPNQPAQFSGQMMPGQPRPAPNWQPNSQQPYGQRPMQPAGQQFGQMQGRGMSPSMNPNMNSNSPMMGPGGQPMMGQQPTGQQQPQQMMQPPPDQQQFR